MILYTSPTKEYQIRLGKSFFGFDLYYVCRYDESLAKIDGVSNYYIIHSFEQEKTCYDWLKEKQIISKDEHKFLVESIKKARKQ